MILNVVVHNIFWITFAGMEGIEEYAEERSPLNEQNNYGKEIVISQIMIFSTVLWYCWLAHSISYKFAKELCMQTRHAKMP